MPGSDKSSNLKFYFLTAAIVFTIGLTVFLYHRILWIARPSAYIELFWFFIFLLIFVSIKDIQAFLTSLPRVHLWIFIVLLFCASTAHYMKAGRTTFPFNHWGMYASHKPNHGTFYECSGITQEGTRVLIRVGKIFPTTSRSFSATLRDELEIVFGFDKGGDDYTGLEEHGEKHGLRKVAFYIRKIFKADYRRSLPKERRGERLDEVIFNIGKKYNDAHLKDPIHTIEIFRGSFHFEGLNPPVFESKLVWQVPIIDRDKL